MDAGLLRRERTLERLIHPTQRRNLLPNRAIAHQQNHHPARARQRPDTRHRPRTPNLENPVSWPMDRVNHRRRRQGGHRAARSKATGDE